MSPNHTIDAKGMKLGRLASSVATLLMGKDRPSFRKNLAPSARVEIINAKLLDITPKRMSGIVHTRYSGHPGGQIQMEGKHVVLQKGYQELIRHAVSRMIPKNKHHSNMLKNLIVKE